MRFLWNWYFLLKLYSGINAAAGVCILFAYRVVRIVRIVRIDAFNGSVFGTEFDAYEKKPQVRYYQMKSRLMFTQSLIGVNRILLDFFGSVMEIENVGLKAYEMASVSIKLGFIVNLNRIQLFLLDFGERTFFLNRWTWIGV